MNKAIQAVIFVVIVVAAIAGGNWYNERLERQNLERESAERAKVAVEQQKIMEQLKTEDVVVGNGVEAKAGNKVSVHYEGKLDDGTVFDSSYKRGQPFEFNLGAGEVIRGWDLGVAGMKVGGKRQLTIPPELAYGARAVGSIPENSTLHFTVELLGVK